MLFGFDNPNQIIKDYKGDLYTNSEVQEYVKYFLKPYWVENEKNIKKFLKRQNYILYLDFLLVKVINIGGKRLLVTLLKKKLN